MAAISSTVHLHATRFTIAGLAGMMLAGCATFSSDGGLGVAKDIVKTEFGADTQWNRSESEMAAAQATVSSLLVAPLTDDSATQIALFNNPGLQAAYSELGSAEASRVQAGRLSNPRFSFKKLGSGEDYSYERTLGISLAEWLTQPMASSIESRRFEAAKLRAASETLDVAIMARRGFYNAVATRQSVEYMKQVVETAKTSHELVRRMVGAGNLNKLDDAREQVFYAESIAQLAQTQQAATSARESLIRTLGLWGGGTEFTLPERLADLPGEPRQIEDIEKTAIEQRLDLRAAKLRLDAQASSLGLTKVTRFINVLDFSLIRESVPGGELNRGYEISIEIPLFDWGGARVAQAEALYLQSVNRVREVAVNARSEVREAYAAYRVAYDVARHYRDEIVPLRKKISDEQALRYNGMLISVFELIADAREQVSTINAYIAPLRDFWLADANLRQALLGGTGAVANIATRLASPSGSAARH